MIGTPSWRKVDCTAHVVWGRKELLLELQRHGETFGLWGFRRWWNCWSFQTNAQPQIFCENQTVHDTAMPTLLKLPSETLDEVTRAITGSAFLKLRATCIELHALDPPTVHPTLGQRFLAVRSMRHAAYRRHVESMRLVCI